MQKILSPLVSLLIFAATCYLTLGFWQPDPYFLEKGKLIVAISWALKIGLPLIGIICLLLFLAWYSKRISTTSVVFLCLSSLLGLLIIYPFANTFYGNSFNEQAAKFHPYLQLAPHALKLKPAQPNTFKIFCLGGSTTEFADPDLGGWPGRLERILKQNLPTKDVQVYNAGRQWYNTQHTLINYQLNLRQYKPDLIILMQTVNDLLVNADFAYISHGIFQADYGHFYGPVNRIIARQSFFGFLSQTVQGLWYYKPRAVIETETFSGLKSYERNLRALAELVTIDRNKLVMMTEPHLFKEQMTAAEQKALHLINYQAVGPYSRWGHKTALAGMNQYNSKLKQIAADVGALVIDLDAEIPKSLDVFYDEVHYRVPTFDLLAQTIASKILASQLISE